MTSQSWSADAYARNARFVADLGLLLLQSFNALDELPQLGDGDVLDGVFAFHDRHLT